MHIPCYFYCIGGKDHQWVLTGNVFKMSISDKTTTDNEDCIDGYEVMELKCCICGATTHKSFCD